MTVVIEIIFNIFLILIFIIENIHDFLYKKSKINFNTILNISKFILQISYIILIIIINHEYLSSTLMKMT